MRRSRPLILAAALMACGGDNHSSSAADQLPSAAAPSLGPDAIVLRVPRGGGLARAYAYPRLDSAVWSSASGAPAIARVLGFDEEAGSLAYVDAKGLPGRLDLRSGGVTTASKVKFVSLTSADGRAVYGIADGKITRLTPSDSWPFTPPAPPREAAPQPDGTLLVVSARGARTVVWRVRPPDARIGDSVVLGASERSVRTRIGDRLYLVNDNQLVGVRVRDFAPSPAVAFAHRIRVVLPTPSGDRLYVTLDSSDAVSVVDRYSGKLVESIELPSTPSDMRMDPLGRYLIVRQSRGDAAWVVALGTNRLIGAVTTSWTSDLPFVGPDGSVATAQGNDVLFLDGETLHLKRRVKNGAKDFWHVVAWNGFRPRAAGLDQPVTFRNSAPDSARTNDAVDSAIAIGAAFDSAGKPDTAAARPTAPRPTPAPAPAPAPAGPMSFLVQFASFPVEERARAATNFAVKGQTPHVVSAKVGGATVYRVVLGPYPTRGAAERVGRDAGRDFVVFETSP